MMINRPPGVDNMAYRVQGYMYVTQLLLKDRTVCHIWLSEIKLYRESCWSAHSEYSYHSNLIRVPTPRSPFLVRLLSFFERQTAFILLASFCMAQDYSKNSLSAQTVLGTS